MTNIIKKKLKIDGMHCSSCAMSIDFDLEDVEGVKSAQTNYAKQESSIEFDPECVKIEDILQVIRRLGYQASILV